MTLKTVPDFNETDEIVLFGVNTGFEQIDAAVAFGPAMALFVVLFSSNTPLILSVPSILLTGVITTTIVLMTPNYMNISEYAKAIKYNIRRQGAVANTETETIPEASMSSFERVKVEESTQGFSKVKRFYPEANLFERDDGCYVAGLRLRPPNRDFDTYDEYVHIASQIREQLNNNVDFSFELYVTTRPFPIEEYMSELESRLEDKDIQDRKIMAALIDELVQERPEALRERGTKLPHYYLIVSADPTDISIDKQGTTSPLERLTTVPYLGGVAEIAASIRDDAEEFEKENRLVGKVQDRVAQLDAAVVRPTEDIESEVVTVVEWAELLRTLWNGEEGANNTVRQQPAIQSDADIPGITREINPRQQLDTPAIQPVALEEPESSDAEVAAD